MFAIPGVMSIIAIGYLYGWKEQRKTFHLLPYIFLAASVPLFFVEYGRIDFELFGVILILLVVMHVGIIWEIFFHNK